MSCGSYNFIFAYHSSISMRKFSNKIAYDAVRQTCLQKNSGRSHHVLKERSQSCYSINQKNLQAISCLYSSRQIRYDRIFCPEISLENNTTLGISGSIALNIFSKGQKLELQLYPWLQRNVRKQKKLEQRQIRI